MLLMHVRTQLLDPITACSWPHHAAMLANIITSIAAMPADDAGTIGQQFVEPVKNSYSTEPWSFASPQPARKLRPANYPVVHLSFTKPLPARALCLLLPRCTTGLSSAHKNMHIALS